MKMIVKEYRSKLRLVGRVYVVLDSRRFVMLRRNYNSGIRKIIVVM